MAEYIPLIMFFVVCLVLLCGYPVAFSLAGTALSFAAIGVATGNFDASLLHALPSRLFGIVNNQTLIAVPLFIFMGVILEKSKIAEALLENMANLFGSLQSGLAISVIVVGMFLAASTGIVGATVVTMGLISLPSMLKKGYSAEIATGTICATGTLGQIIPPSIALVLLGDVLSTAYQQAQLNLGNFSPKTVSVNDLFIGALVPGLLLILLYIIYVFVAMQRKPITKDTIETQKNHGSSALWKALGSLIPPLLLIALVLGSILGGFATPTEAAGVGAFGALLLAIIKRQLTVKKLQEIVQNTTKITCMVFLILIGASIFSLVFRGFGGDELIQNLFASLPGGHLTAMLIVMLLIFLLGFILDFIEIIFVVVPIVGPILLMMGIDPIWLGIMIAINLQTSFLTPPFGFSLFYLRGIAPKSLPTTAIYKGVTPFIGIQLLLLLMLAIWPQLATWLPGVFYPQ